jgi:predicted nucleic acid-binding protein
MRPVFADAFYFVACLNRLDQYHQKAVAAASQYTGKILTTWCVLIETADALAASSTRTKAHAFITALKKDPSIIIAADEQGLLRRGLQRYGDRQIKVGP